MLEIFRCDVKECFHFRQGQFQILGRDRLAVDGRVVGRYDGHRFAGTLGIPHPRQVVVGQRKGQQPGTGQHRRTNGLPVQGNDRRGGQHQRRRQGACRRVQATQPAHQYQRHARRQASATQGAAQYMGHQQRDDRRTQVTADKRPGLGEGAR
ncbi:hypothetical protein D3C78_1425060 [compost metagenome]